jgi:DNA-binding MarR family transcriptional regulator
MQEAAQPPKEPLPVLVGRRWRILHLLAQHGEGHVSELATRILIKVPDMSTYLGELAEYGLVLSRNMPGPIGGERKMVRLSPEGQRIHDFFDSEESSGNEPKTPSKEDLAICLRAAQPNSRLSIEFQRMLAEKFVELCRGAKVEETAEGKGCFKNLVLDPGLNGVDEKIAGRFRAGLSLVLGRLVKHDQGMQWFLKELYPAISKAAFSQNLPVKIRVDFMDALSRIYSSLLARERTILRNKLLDSYFSNSDPDLHSNLLEVIARAREMEPDKSAILRSIDEKLENSDQSVRTRAEQLLGNFAFGWTMEKYRAEGIITP